MSFNKEEKLSSTIIFKNLNLTNNKFLNYFHLFYEFCPLFYNNLIIILTNNIDENIQFEFRINQRKLSFILYCIFIFKYIKATI